MATIGSNTSTLADVASRLDGDGKISAVVELLNETNEILDDMQWVEGNLPTGHRTTIRSGLPSVTWRKLNFGVQPSKSTTTQVTESVGMLESYAEVDKALADLNGNTAAFRLSEDRAFIEAMNQEMQSTLFYGDSSTDPEEFMGLAPRYTSTSAANGENVLLGGGSGSDNCSIWLVVWGPNTVQGIYPKGSKGGLSMEDLGRETLIDSSNGLYEGYRTHYKWDCGISVRDWRYAVRIANISVAALTKDASGSSADIVDLMIQAIEIPRNLGLGRPVFYCNQTIKSILRRQVLNSNNVRISMDEVAGKKVMTFDGIPVKRTDALLITEATIS